MQQKTEVLEEKTLERGEGYLAYISSYCILAS